MAIEQRFQVSYEEEATDTPGLVLGQDGSISVVAPGGTRRGLGDGGAKSVSRLLSSPEILALQDAPIELAPAPGPGKAYVVLSALFVYRFGTIAYFGNGPGASKVVVGPRDAVLADRSNIELLNAGQGATDTNLLEQAASCWVQINSGDVFGASVGGSSGGGPTLAMLDNQPLIVGMPTGVGYTPWMQGDGTLGVAVVYVVLQLP